MNRANAIVNEISSDEVCRKMGINEETFYTWRRRYGAMGATSCARSGCSRGRSAASNTSWPTSRSTSTCSKRCWQKKSEAIAQEAARDGREREVRGEHPTELRRRGALRWTHYYRARRPEDSPLRIDPSTRACGKGSRRRRRPRTCRIDRRCRCGRPCSQGCLWRPTAVACKAGSRSKPPARKPEENQTWTTEGASDS
jgi:Transposase